MPVFVNDLSALSWSLIEQHPLSRSPSSPALAWLRHAGRGTQPSLPGRPLLWLPAHGSRQFHRPRVVRGAMDNQNHLLPK